MAKNSGNTRMANSSTTAATRTISVAPKKKPPLKKMRNMQSIHKVMQAYGTINNVPGETKTFVKDLSDAIMRAYNTQKEIYYKRYNEKIQEAEKNNDTKLNDKENKLYNNRIKKLSKDRDKLDDEYRKFIKVSK